MKPSDFLPSFFKYAKRGVALRDDGDDTNVLAPTAQKPIVKPVVPAIVAPTVAPALPPKVSIPYRVPSLDTASAPDAPIPPPNLTPMIDPAATARVSGHVYPDKRGRPQAFDPALDPASDEKTLAVNKAYQNYDPAAKPATGWRKWVPTMISGAIRGLGRGGVGGAIFGAAEGGIGGAVDPSRANREWQRKKLGETAPIVGGIQKERKAQADIEEQQAETAQRRMSPIIAAAELKRKQEYDDARLEIQAKVADGRMSAAKATNELKRLEINQRAEEGKLNRASREKIATMRPDATEAAAAEGEALASSTQEAAGALQQELDQHKGQLIENERAITTKEGLWSRQAAQIVAADPSIKLKDALEQVKALDPDVQSGVYDQTVNNTKALRDAVGDKEKRLASMAEDVRKGSAKAARGTGADPLKGKQWSKSRYKGSKSVDEAAKEAARRGAIVVD